MSTFFSHKRLRALASVYTMGIEEFYYASNDDVSILILSSFQCSVSYHKAQLWLVINQKNKLIFILTMALVEKSVIFKAS